MAEFKGVRVKGGQKINPIFSGSLNRFFIGLNNLILDDKADTKNPIHFSYLCQIFLSF